MAKTNAAMQGTPELAEALNELRAFFHRHDWSYCLIGGLAAIQWGEPRFTQDIDVVVSAPIGEEPPIVDALLDEFPTRLRKSEARQFAFDNRILLLNSRSGVPIDISLGALEFEAEMIARAKPQEVVRGAKFPMASAADVVVMKTIAGRPGDWRDIEGIITKQRNKLDWNHIFDCLGPLLETLETPERARQLEDLRRRIELETLTTKAKKSPSTKKKKS